MCSGGNEEDITRIGKKGRSGQAVAMGNDGLTDEVKAIALLLATGFDGGKNALDEGAAVGRMSAIRQAAPDDGVTQGTFRNMVGGFDAGMGSEGPQGGFKCQEVGTGACRLGIRTARALT